MPFLRKQISLHISTNPLKINFSIINHKSNINYIYNYYARVEQLKSILRAYYERIKGLEDKKYDVEYVVKRKDIEV